MPNCRRRFATENEVTKHIDNHMNPSATKTRRANNTNSNANSSHTAAAVATAAAAAAANHLMNESKNAAAQQFLNNNNPVGQPGDNKNNILPRSMGGGANTGSQVKNELYFPQCYGPPFQHPFQGQPQAAHAGAGQSGVSVSVANSVAPGVVVQQNAATSVVAQ